MARTPEQDKRYDDLSASMNWPPRFYRGIDVPFDWLDDIEELHNKLKAADPEYLVLQIKTKFGGLRYYFQPKTASADTLQAIVDPYEIKYNGGF